MIHYFIVFKIIVTNKFFQLSKATEMFIIIRGKAIFTVGIQEKIVGGNGDPTTIFVPGNVPHQVKFFFIRLNTDSSRYQIHSKKLWYIFTVFPEENLSIKI